MLRVGIFAAVLCYCNVAHASYWTVQKNERDPFDKTKGTFVATTVEDGHALAVRCLEGTLSLALSIPSGSLDRGETLDVKIVSDEKDPISTEGGVLNSNVMFALVQFGDEDTLKYLAGSKKFFFRTTTTSSTNTFGFTGGKSFEDTIRKAEVACGAAMTPTSPQIQTTSPSPSPTAQASTNWTNKDCSKERSCASQTACLVEKHQLGDEPDTVGYIGWCRRQPGMIP